MKQFNVIMVDFNTKHYYPYDVMPFFVETFKAKKYEAKKVKTKEDLKEWADGLARYQFWSRCQYECCISYWPCKPDDIEVRKIDVYTQLSYNMDVFVDLLAEELKIK